MNLQDRQERASALAAAYPGNESRPILLTVAQFSERNPAFTKAAVRNLIFKAGSRQSSRGEIPGNGLSDVGAIIRLGRRVLVDEAKFLKWAIERGCAPRPAQDWRRRLGEGAKG